MELGFRLFVMVGAWNLGSALVHCVVHLAMYASLRTWVLSHVLRALGDLELGFRLRVYVTMRFGTWVPSRDA